MFQSKTVVELKAIAKERGLKGVSKLRKSELIDVLENGDDNLTEVKSDVSPRLLEKKVIGMSKFVKIGQIGHTGKEGTVYLVMDPKSLKKYAMKTFRKKKSPKTMEKEANYQYLASKAGISPEIIEYNQEEKYIVMDLLSKTLIDILKEQNGMLTQSQQKQIIELYHSLDKIGVMINDANPLNIMEKNGKFYMIDFGMAKMTNHKDFKAYQKPNFQLMPLGLLLWLKDKFRTSRWEYIRSQVSQSHFEKLKMETWP